VRVAVYETGHEIADTVAKALFNGLGGTLVKGSSPFPFADVHIGYGVLRGQADVFKKVYHWFELDKGYNNPGHYDGNYRISYRGTQARWHEGIPRGKWDGELEPMREYDPHRPILFCPPTEAVERFFKLQDWYLKNIPVGGFIKREKGERRPLKEDLDRCRAVITFNSSVGWEALRRGIPCLSDVNHSLVGSFYGETDLNKLIQKTHEQPDRRRELFDIMAGHQFTLKEIQEGKAWPIINYYLAGSDSIAASQLPPTFASTPSSNALAQRFQSSI
jgi:hypothetical protein